jgi:hypothetical protein
MYSYPHRPSEHYDRDLLNFHLAHFRAGRTQFCMTCSYKVSKDLAQENIPVFFIYQAPFTIRKTLTAILQTLNSPHANNLKLVVGLFRTDRLSSQNPQLETSMHTLRRLFSTYGEKRDILIFQCDSSTFQSVQTYNNFLLETNNFDKIPLSSQVRSAVPGVSIRIGYGLATNLKVAQAYAEKALEMACDENENHAFLFDGSSGWKAGKAKPSFVLSSEQGDSFQALSQKIGITPATLSRYFQALRSFDTSFSASDFSLALGLHPKSVRKILAHLLKAGIVMIESSRAPLHKGRPEYLYRCT